MLGGGMRQTGWLCACGLEALSEANIALLAVDHANARTFALELATIAGLLASTVARDGGARVWAMILIVLWLLLPPALAITLGLSGDLAKMSPLFEVWTIASDGPAEIAPGDWRRVAIEFAVAAAIWCVAIGTATGGEESADSVA